MEVESDQETKASIVAPEKATMAWKQELIPPPLPVSSSPSPDEPVAGPYATVSHDDFRTHQELLKYIASNLGLQMEELKEPADKLF